MDDKEEKITLNSLQIELNSLLFDFKKLRTDWEQMQEKFIDALASLEASKKQLEAYRPSKLPISVRELMQLKQMGIKPQDLLRKLGLNLDEEKTGNERQEVSSGN